MADSSEARTRPIAEFVPELDRLAADAMADWKVPGAALAVVQDGKVALAKAYGQRDVEAVGAAPPALPGGKASKPPVSAPEAGGRAPCAAAGVPLAIRFPRKMIEAIDAIRAERLDEPDRATVIREMVAKGMIARR
jgi:hypothetical protein